MRGVGARGLAFACGLVLLSACSPGGDTRPVLRVASQKGGTKALVEASGALQGAPYKVEWSEFPSAQTLLEALGDHAADLGAVGDAPFLFAYAGNPDLKAVAAYDSLSGGGSVALLVPRASALKSLSDLKGRRIATGRGSIGHFLVLKLLQKAGLQPGDVRFVYLSPGDAKTALANGAVDVWATWGSYIGLSVLHGDGRVLADGKDVLSSINFEASTTRSIHDKAPQIQDFLRRLDQAEVWRRSHIDAYAAVLSKETSLPPDVALDTVRKYALEPRRLDTALIAEETGNLDLYARAGLLNHPPPVSSAVAPQFDAGRSLTP